MFHQHKGRSLALALLATTMFTQPGPARAAPGDTLGPEFQVNSFTTDSQGWSALAMDADGDFVVAWTSFSQDTSSDGIFAQRFDTAGVAQGSEFKVNAFVSGVQSQPAVAMDADGDFVVAWQSDVQDLSSFGIYAQRFDAAGVPQGGEIKVNTFTLGAQSYPAVAMDADGDFVVVWQSFNQVGADWDVFAQRFDAAGVSQGAEFQVNTFTTGGQLQPAVAMDADGDFAVVWNSFGGDGSSWGVFARSFDAAGVPQGAEFQVNTFATGPQRDPAIAMDADGDFVVAWQSYNQVSADWDVFAQRYDVAGVPQGAEVQVNTATSNPQWQPAVAMDADGDFVVTWRSSGQDGDSDGIFAQRFNTAGAAHGLELQVNSYTTGNQTNSAVAMDADGDFVVSWTDYSGQDGSSAGIFAQRYEGVQRIEGDFDGDGNADLLWRNPANGHTILWLMEGTEKRAAQSLGTVPVVWQIAGTGDFNGDGKADVLWRNTATGDTRIWQMDGFRRVDAASIGRPPLAWVVEQLRDTDGDGSSDIFWRNTTTGATVIWRMSGFTKTIVGSTGTVGPAWQVQ